MEGPLSYVHRPGPEPLVGDTIGAYLGRVATRHAEDEALVSVHQGLRFTYAELCGRVNELARGLVAIGAQRGTRIGIWSTDHAEWALLQLATARIGAVLVNLDPAYRAKELGYALGRARVEVLVFQTAFRESDYASLVCEACPEARSAKADALASARFPDLRRLVVFDPEDAAATRSDVSGFLTWGRLLAGGRAVDPAELERRAAQLDRDDPINVQFTSGTTGRPKATLLTHHNLLNNALATGTVLGLGPADRLCMPVPFQHCFGMVVSSLTTFAHGATLVLPAPHFDAAAVLAAVEQERCTVLHGVPTMFVAELEHPDFERFDLSSSLRTGIMAGAPVPDRSS